MVIMKPILIGFVTLFVSCFAESSYLDDLGMKNCTPEKQIEVIKRMVRFDADQIYDREWAMVENTCKEMHTVMDKLNGNMKTDLSLFMKDVQENANHDPPPEDKEMGQCLKRAKDQIDLAIQEGVDSFTECIQLPKVLQANDEKILKKMQKKYKLSVGYTLSKVDRCRRYSNVHSSGQLHNCLQGTIDESVKQFAKTSKVFKDGRCVGHFTAILHCVADVFNKTAQKKEMVKSDITKCTEIEYGFEVEKEENFKLNVSSILERHLEYYKNLLEGYNGHLHKGFLILNMKQIEQENLLSTPEDKLKAYYEVLKKGLTENWSVEEKKCNDKAVAKLDTLKREELKDYKECENNYNQKINRCINEYIQMAKEFNQKLQVAGNVALLKCFGDRPQDIFNSKSIQECVSLSKRNIEWEYRKDLVREYYLKDYLDYDFVLSNGKTCGELRNKKLTLDADGVLNEYSRCLYGVSGHFYTATTPKTSTLAPWTEGTTFYAVTSPRGPLTTGSYVPHYTGLKRGSPTSTMELEN